MIFKRNIYNKLLTWKKEKKGTTALLIEGARRVGKEQDILYLPMYMVQFL